VPALETSHGIAYAIQRASELPEDALLICNLSGRGDKDVQEVAKVLGGD
jgi:tryptophan synthase beta chain